MREMLKRSYNTRYPRKRMTHSYTNDDFIWGYDTDKEDFFFLVSKMKNNEELSKSENKRYGYYVDQIGNVLMRNKHIIKYSDILRDELKSLATFEILTKLVSHYDLSRGSKCVWNYAFNIGYHAIMMYFRNKKKEKERCTPIRDNTWMLNTSTSVFNMENA